MRPAGERFAGFPPRFAAPTLAAAALCFSALFWSGGDDDTALVWIGGLTLATIATLLFVPVTQWLGLYVASFILIAGFMIVVGHLKAWKSLLTGFVFSALMFLTFEVAFDVIMPKGPLEHLFGY